MISIDHIDCNRRFHRRFLALCQSADIRWGLSSGGIFSNPATGALLNNLVKIVPTSAFSAAMLIDANRWSTLLYGLIACALNVLSVVLLLAVADKIYLRGVLGIQGGQSAKQLTATETARKLTPRSAYRAILHKEWILLLRTPAFFTQTVFFVLFFPVIMVVSFAISFSRAPETTEKGFNLINFLRQWISSGAWQDSIWIIVLIVGGIAAFFSGTALLSASAISRQGATFNISKIIPVPLRTQVLAWLTPGFTLLTAIWIIITVALAIFLRMPLSLALLVLPSPDQLVFHAVVGFWVDMKSPLLTWSNEIELLKTHVPELYRRSVISPISVSPSGSPSRAETRNETTSLSASPSLHCTFSLPLF